MRVLQQAWNLSSLIFKPIFKPIIFKPMPGQGSQETEGVKKQGTE
jgi:hypothetical protein